MTLTRRNELRAHAGLGPLPGFQKRGALALSDEQIIRQGLKIAAAKRAEPLMPRERRRELGLLKCPAGHYFPFPDRIEQALDVLVNEYRFTTPTVGDYNAVATVMQPYADGDPILLQKAMAQWCYETGHPVPKA